MLRETNHSFIVLIPKGSNAATVQQDSNGAKVCGENYC